MENNPVVVDGGAAAVRTGVQVAIAHAIVSFVGVAGFWVAPVAVLLSGVTAVAMHILTEYFPGWGKVFSAGLAKGAARYLRK